MVKHLCIYLFSFSTVFPFVLLLCSTDSCAQIYTQERRFFAKRYTLYGSLELNYDRSWVEGGEPTTTFTQGYNLGLRGFVIDPRLVTFDVSGIFTKVSIRPGDGYSLMGRNLNVILFEKLPPRLLRAWGFIPNPIILRYSHYSNTYDYTNYGITLRHAMPEEVKARRQQERPGSPIIFPTTFFDFDRYEYKSADFNTVTNAYSLRSFLTGKTYDYRFLFENVDQTGTTEYKRTTVEFQPNYRFYDEGTRRLFDIFNIVRWDKIDDRKTIDVRSLQRWYKPFGRDSLQVTGSIVYSGILSGEKAENYNASVTADYTKVFSPVVSNIASVSVGYGKIDDRNTHSGRAGDSVTVEISRIFRGKSSAFIGINQNGMEYGLDAYLYTKTRINASLGYTFASLFPDDGKTVAHRIILDASGPMFNNVSFTTNLQYLIRDVSQADNPFSERSILYSANIFWYVARTSVSLGGTYASTRQRNGASSEGKITSVQGTVSRLLTKRTFLNIYSTWTKDSSADNTVFEFRPRLSWNTRQTFIDVEYDYRRTSTGGLPAVNDHRIFVRFVRRFSRDFFFR